MSPPSAGLWQRSPEPKIDSGQLHRMNRDQGRHPLPISSPETCPGRLERRSRSAKLVRDSRRRDAQVFCKHIARSAGSAREIGLKEVFVFEVDGPGRELFSPDRRSQAAEEQTPSIPARRRAEHAARSYVLSKCSRDSEVGR